MSKVRVYELARELKVESKLLMNTLKMVGIAVPSHQSMLSDEQVDQVRKAISGEALGVATPKPASAARAADPSVRVIRRRRPGDGVNASEEGIPGGGEAAENMVAPASESSATPMLEKVESVGDVVSGREQVASPVSDRTQEFQSPATIARGPARDTNVNLTGPSSTTSELNRGSVTPPSGPGAPRGDLPPRDRSRRVTVSGGATIVRKATPEEIQNQQQRRSEPYSNRPPGRTFRREDSRGTKYTGIGVSQPDIAAIPPIETDEMAASKAARRLKDKKKETVEEPEEAVARKAVAKGAKRTGYNMRQLLSEIEELEDNAEEIPTPEVEEAPEQQRQQKTVYTPSVAQKKRDLKRRKDLKKTNVTVSRASYRIVRMGNEITVGELAHQLKVKGTEVIKKLMDQGVMVTMNQNIDFDTATLMASEYGFEVKSNVRTVDDVLGKSTNAELSTTGAETRSPIVTVMGHVDHGKTSILDAIRQTDVAAGEAGGITQHIGAYSVVHDGKKITFLDTPGHEAFSSMRARGANITDIVVLVVAADDGVMPQTKEAISHAREAKVPIIVAVNKIDKPGADVDRIFRELSEQEILAEEWGGEVQCVRVSAHTKQGINELLEAILLQSEVLELRTSTKGDAQGVVVEAHLDQGRGPVATILIRHGILKAGDYFVTGMEFGRVRAMYDHNGKKVDEAGPSTPVEVLGLSGVPLAGDRASVVKDERTARDAVGIAKDGLRSQNSRTAAQTLEDLLGRMGAAETPELPVILKADTQGSLEAIAEALTKLNTERVKNTIVHKAVGGITESDIALAAPSNAVVVGFNVRAGRGLDDQAEKAGVLIKYFSIIYDLVDATKALMAGKLPPIVEEVVIGRAEVRQSISVSKVGTIAGSAVIDGFIKRSANLRVIRDAIVIYSGKIGSLRRFKEDVREVKSGYECGISVENYNDIREGDILEAYEIKETRPTL